MHFLTIHGRPVPIPDKGVSGILSASAHGWGKAIGELARGAKGYAREMSKPIPKAAKAINAYSIKTKFTEIMQADQHHEVRVKFAKILRVGK